MPREYLSYHPDKTNHQKTEKRVKLWYILPMIKTTNKQNDWNFKLLLGKESEAEITKIREKAKIESYKFINKWQNRTDWLNKPNVLKEALDDFEIWAKSFGTNSTEEYYYNLRYAQNQNDPKIKAKLGKADDLSNEIQNGIRFFSLKLAKISNKKQKEFLNNPLFSKYHHFLEDLFKNA